MSAIQPSDCPVCGSPPETVSTASGMATWTRVHCPRCVYGAGDWEFSVAVDKWNKTCEVVRDAMCAAKEGKP